MNDKSGQSYKDLIVWQKAMDLVVAVYELTEHYPKTELYGLTAHTNKTVISIPPNIAEGKRRGSTRDFRRFLIIAFASGAELETQLEIAKRLSFTEKINFSLVDKLLNEVMRMLNSMIHNFLISNSLLPTSY